MFAHYSPSSFALAEPAEPVAHQEILRQLGSLRDFVYEDHQGAETYFKEAIQVARSQKAKTLELRSMTSLFELQSDVDVSLFVELSELVKGFDQGGDSCDLTRARQFLEESTLLAYHHR